MITKTGSDKQTGGEQRGPKSPPAGRCPGSVDRSGSPGAPHWLSLLSLRPQQRVGPRWARACRCWGCPRRALREGERGPRRRHRRAGGLRGWGGGVILCPLPPQGLLQGGRPPAPSAVCNCTLSHNFGQGETRAG